MPLAVDDGCVPKSFFLIELFSVVVARISGKNNEKKKKNGYTDEEANNLPDSFLGVLASTHAPGPYERNTGSHSIRAKRLARVFILARGATVCGEGNGPPMLDGGGMIRRRRKNVDEASCACSARLGVQVMQRGEGEREIYEKKRRIRDRCENKRRAREQPVPCAGENT